MDSKELGVFGEQTAEKFLKDKGYKILDRNFKRKWGELDIVGLPPRRTNFWCKRKKKDEKIVFFEVKTIVKKSGFLAEDEINQKKKSQLRKMSQIYLSQNKMPFDTACQIDIIAIEVSSDFKEVKIRHHQNAVEDKY